MLHKSALRKMTLTVLTLTAIVIVALVPTARASAASGYLNIGPSGSWGFAEWYTSSNNLRLIAQPTSVASGYCLDSWFDWGTEGGVGGHYDARVARSCRGGYQRDSGLNTEAHNVTGVNRRAACYGPNNATTGNCRIGTGNVADVQPNLPNTCTRSWRLTSGGSYFIDSGGNPRACGS
jgi:hypothetical protein